MTIGPIVVPASTSNLGPGFDALGLAFQCYLTLRVVAIDDERRTTDLVCRFASPPPDGDNLIETGYRAYGAAAGVPLPRVTIEVDSRIPMRSGLGSSAAALVAGLDLGARLAPRPDVSLLDLGTRLEGHPDNVSAALLGGWTTSVVEASGRVVSRAHHWPNRFKPVVAIPERRLATRIARGVLAPMVPLTDAVFNLQRVALLVDALSQADPDALRSALDDRLHQPARCAIIPGLEAALRLRHPRLMGVFLSGAGPSIIAICDEETAEVEALLRATYTAQAIPARIEPIAVQQPFDGGEHSLAVSAVQRGSTVL